MSFKQGPAFYENEWPWQLILKVLNFCCTSRSSPSVVFLGKGVLKICTNITGEHSCQSVISIKLLFKTIKKVMMILNHNFRIVLICIVWFLFINMLAFTTNFHKSITNLSLFLGYKNCILKTKHRVTRCTINKWII